MAKYNAVGSPAPMKFQANIAFGKTHVDMRHGQPQQLSQQLRHPKEAPKKSSWDHQTEKFWTQSA